MKQEDKLENCYTSPSENSGFQLKKYILRDIEKNLIFLEV